VSEAVVVVEWEVVRDVVDDEFVARDVLGCADPFDGEVPDARAPLGWVDPMADAAAPPPGLA